MLLFAGLANPEPRYEDNRHNIGFRIADAIHARHRFGPWRQRFHGETAEGEIAGERILLLKPMTFMNESGRAAAEVMNFFKDERPWVEAAIEAVADAVECLVLRRPEEFQNRVHLAVAPKLPPRP